MSDGCPYCTQAIDEDTGEPLESCKRGFYYHDEHHNNTLIRAHLWRDRDDGSWWWTILMHDDWPERTLPIVMSAPAPPHCPNCGRRLYEQDA